MQSFKINWTHKVENNSLFELVDDRQNSLHLMPNGIGRCCTVRCVYDEGNKNDIFSTHIGGLLIWFFAPPVNICEAFDNNRTYCLSYFIYYAFEGATVPENVSFHQSYRNQTA